MSFHHWMYCGCQCSSARCRRLFEERPTLFGIFSAEIIDESSSRATCYVLRATCYVLRAGATCSGSVEVELRSFLRAVGRQGTVLADGVRADEDPVLPGGETAEDLRFH